MVVGVMKMEMNGVVEVVNSYEDGVLSVGKYGLSDWKYLWCVFDGVDEGIGSKVGSMETVNFVDGDNNVSWELLEKNIKEKFKEYKDGEIEDGYGSYLNEDDEEVEFDWDKVEKEMLEGVKNLFEDGMEVSKVLIGGYSIECDNEFVVIVMKMQ